MTNSEIKKLNKGTTVDEAVGTITSIKRPEEQSEHDQVRNRHRQKIQITDAGGTSLWCVLEKEKMHLTPDNKGRVLVLQSTPDESGMHGLTLDRWVGRGDTEFVELQVSGSASVYFQEQEEERPTPNSSGRPPEVEAAAQTLQQEEQRTTQLQREATKKRPRSCIVTDHANVLEQCWKAIDFVEEDKVRQALASTLFIELGRKNLIAKVVEDAPEPDDSLKRKMAEMEDCLREAIDLMEDTRNGAYKPDSVTTQPWVRCLENAPVLPADDSSGDPDWDVKHDPVAEANVATEPDEDEEAEKAYDKLVEEKLHGRFSRECIDRAFDDLQKQMHLNNAELCRTIVADPDTFKDLCEVAEEAIREEDEIPMD